LARRVLGRELTFKVRKRRCTVAVYLSGFEPAPNAQTVFPLGNNSVFLCD
jgi:hypothetical protein